MLNFKGALVMVLFEYFVLLRLYRRSHALEMISLVVAPLMILLANYFADTPYSIVCGVFTHGTPLVPHGVQNFP